MIKIQFRQEDMMLKRKAFLIGLIVVLYLCLAPKTNALGAAPAMMLIANDAEIADPIPSAGVTENQPFASGTGGSEYFRIPAFNVMEDGTYVCASDARWNHTEDGIGSDIIFSISEDEGRSWAYSFPFYFADSNSSKVLPSEVATFIDPEIVTKGDTIYLFVDACPTGVMSDQKFPAVGTGYINVNGKMRLALTDQYKSADINPKTSDVQEYSYYVGDFVDGYAAIFNRADGEKTIYYVDELYNIYKKTLEGLEALSQKQVNSNAIVGQNVFYRDSLFHVYNTSYIYMAKSDDKGKSWSYEILNPQIKRDNDAELATSSGNGLVLQDGTIVVSIWERPVRSENPGVWIYSNEDRSGFIYSKDNGVTWKRMEGIGVYSNENHIVELNDKTLRMFYRYDAEGGKISYIDAKIDGGEYIWQKNCQSELEADVACNLSVLSYSKTVGGKQVVLISCPATYSRRNGTIFLCQVEEGMSLTLLGKFVVTEEVFAYSAMDELKDGSIGLLYETGIGAGNLVFTKIGIEEIAGDIKFDVIAEPSNPDVLPEKGTILRNGKEKYKVMEEGATVAFINTERKTKSMVIPAAVKIGGTKYKVTSIAASAFKNDKRLTTVTLGTEIREIGKEAFKGCRTLKRIVIKSKNLSNVGRDAFKGIKQNAKIKVPARQLKIYKKLLKGKGQGSKVKIVK